MDSSVPMSDCEAILCPKCNPKLSQFNKVMPTAKHTVIKEVDEDSSETTSHNSPERFSTDPERNSMGIDT